MTVTLPSYSETTGGIRKCLGSVGRGGLAAGAEGKLALSFILYPLRFFLKNSMVRCQASVAAALS